jgi:hypothetical protein
MSKLRPPLRHTFPFLVLFLLAAGQASAHRPTISAEAVCDVETNSIVIEYVSTAWAGFPDDPSSRENAQIDILVDGVIADSGAYAAPDYSFGDALDAPSDAVAGDVVIVAAVAVADWGNGRTGGQSESVSIVIPDDDCGPDEGLGRFTGGGHQIRVDGVRVTRGLTIHCDLLLSNNLEVNWNGNKFHMTEHLETVSCTDDPDIIQAPPPAPLDTLVGVGTGRHNNVDGFTIEFTLVDAGEPGVDDEMAILIYETANPANVALEVVKQKLTGGNLQAHKDQPHM